MSETTSGGYETPQTYLAGAAAAGSAALLAGALISQYIGGLSPCPMCIWQRWPHGAAILLGAALLVPALRESRVLRALGALAALTTAGIGIYHTGVERGIFEGPGTCTSNQDGSMSADQLLNSIMTAPIVRCDEVAWEMLGLSMASWNALISLGLAGLWLASLKR